jgi:hypothetical protein
MQGGTLAAIDWTEVIRAVDPHRTLSLAEMDELYVPFPYGPADKIARRLRAWRRTHQGRVEMTPPPKVVFCGARGSGKSTQLRRLAHQVRGEWEFLLLDLAQVLPERTGTLQVVAQIGVALLARLGEWEPEEPTEALVQRLEPARGLRSALAEFVPDVDLSVLVPAIKPLLVAASVDPASAAVVQAAAPAAGWGFRALRQALSPAADFARAPKFMGPLHGEDLGAAREVVRQVSLIAGLLHERAARPVLVLVDGLDKTQRLEDVLAAFDDVELLRELDVSLVLTAPTNLRHDVRFAGLRQDIDTMIHFDLPVVDAQGAPRDEGIEPLVALVRARLGARREAISEETLRSASLWSSGIPRDCLMLLRDASLLAEDDGSNRVDRLHVAEAAKQTRLMLQQALTATDLGYLSRILETRRMGDTPREQELLYENYVACYPNDDAYFRPHQLLADWVRSEARRIASLDDRVGEE